MRSLWAANWKKRFVLASARVKAPSVVWARGPAIGSRREDAPGGENFFSESVERLQGVDSGGKRRIIM